MAKGRRNLFVLLFVAAMLIGSAVVIASKPTRLGLDLRGGTELVYQGRGTPQNPQVEGEDIERSIEIIRSRTDSLGVAEPEISRIGTDSVRVGLPDVQNAERAIDQVGDTAQLHFYDWEPNVIPNPDATGDPGDADFPRIYDAVKFAAEQDVQCTSSDSELDPDREYKCTTNGPTFYLFDSQTQQLVSGPAGAREDLFLEGGDQDLPPPDRREIVQVPQGVRVVKSPPVGSADVPEDPNRARWFVIHDRPELTGDEIRDPQQVFDPTTNQPVVSFDFSERGRAQFEEVTRRIAERGFGNAPPGTGSNSANASQFSESFAIVLDDEVVSRAIINFAENPAGIDGRNGAQIEGGFDIQEAQDLAEFLKIGALPVELKLISQSTVSATLGEQALDQGLKAGIAGLILVIAFMLVYYRFLGFVAVSGLAIYGAFFYALMEMIPVTLTLPGIAGLILTIGVAADSNVVIFERIKEEAREGKSMPSAIANGYRKGIATIIDANVITLITAFILFVLATSGVKGFAFTLGLGTVASLFTAVVFTQAFLGLFGRARFIRSPSFLGAGEQRVRWHLDFAGASKWFFSMSGAILAIGAVAFADLQLNLGLDFESGTRIEAGLSQPAEVEEVRNSLSTLGVDDAKIQEVQSEELGQNAVQIQTATLEPEQVGEVQGALDDRFGLIDNGFDTTSIGPTFGEQVAESAIYALIFSLLVIMAYVSFRFEPKYAIPVMIAVVHDILITGGIYSLTEREVTSATVAAFLTILGYSLYDTVIVFDRIRENVPRLPRAAFSQVVNRSVSEVMTRSLITGLASVFLVGVLLVFGGETLKDFAFAMMIGIASGTYSSIFIASPVLMHWKQRERTYRHREERIKDMMGYVPAFPEDNVVAKVEGEGVEAEGEAAEPAERAEPPEGLPEREPKPERKPPPESPAAGPTSPVPGVVPEPPSVEPPPPAAKPETAAATDVEEDAPGPQERPRDGGNGEEDGEDGDGAGRTDHPELSEASAAALERARQRRKEGKRRRRGKPR